MMFDVMELCRSRVFLCSMNAVLHAHARCCLTRRAYNQSWRCFVAHIKFLVQIRAGIARDAYVVEVVRRDVRSVQAKVIA